MTTKQHVTGRGGGGLRHQRRRRAGGRGDMVSSSRLRPEECNTHQFIDTLQKSSDEQNVDGNVHRQDSQLVGLRLTDRVVVSSGLHPSSAHRAAAAAEAGRHGTFTANRPTTPRLRPFTQTLISNPNPLDHCGGPEATLIVLQ